MKKPVKAVIATARALINVMSQAKLPDESMRLILNTVVTDYINQAIMESDDRFLHRVPVTLTHDTETGDYKVTFTDGGVTYDEFTPQYVYYTDPTDPDLLMHKIYLSDLDNYGSDVIEKYWKEGRKVGAFYGNTYDKVNPGMFLKLDSDTAAVAAVNWIMVYKAAPAHVLDYNDYVPFPANHIGLIETELAFRSIDSVDDDSPAWEKRYMRLKQSLGLTRMEQKMAFDKWVEGEGKSRSRMLPMYNYKAPSRRRVVRVERLEE